MHVQARVLCALAITTGAAAVAAAGCGAGAPAGTAPAPAVGSAPSLRLPLSFVANAGQAGHRISYLARSGGAALAFTRRGVVLAGGSGPALRLDFVGADRHVRLVAGHRDGGRVNYVVGERSRWRVGLPTFRTLTYRGLWPGIDLTFHGRAGTLKYAFRVAPGADPRAIRLAYAGARGLALGTDGGLRIRTRRGTATDSRPVSYQLRDGHRLAVASRFVLRGGPTGYRFGLAGYDRGRPLVIDPGLDYSTFLGGAGADEALGVAVDATGSAYVTGRTLSDDFPGASESTATGSDVFVTKLTPDGSAIVYSTLIGGAGDDEGLGIAVDRAGSAYVTGQTWSADYPTTAGALQPVPAGGGDAFVTRLAPDGGAPAASTVLGGAARDTGLGIAVRRGAAYVAGYTASEDFPVTARAAQPLLAGGTDAFVTKLDGDGTTSAFSTFVGGAGADAAFGIAVDRAGHAYLAGRTGSADYPTTPGAPGSVLQGGYDAVATELSRDGSALDYSTLLGGTGLDSAAGIAVGRDGTAYLTGITDSSDYPVTSGAAQTGYGGAGDAFVTALGCGGTGPVYSTFLGGGDRDEGTGVAVDASGSAYVTGQTASADQPVTADAVDPTFNGVADAFVTRLSSGGADLAGSTFLGGQAFDRGAAIALEGDSAYVAGATLSADYPAGAGALDATPRGGRDAFVTRLSLGGPAPPLPARIPEDDGCMTIDDGG